LESAFLVVEKFFDVEMEAVLLVLIKLFDILPSVMLIANTMWSGS
jgi:hypothetical protein